MFRIRIQNDLGFSPILIQTLKTQIWIHPYYLLKPFKKYRYHNKCIKSFKQLNEVQTMFFGYFLEELEIMFYIYYFRPLFFMDPGSETLVFRHFLTGEEQTKDRETSLAPRLAPGSITSHGLHTLLAYRRQA